MNALPSPETPSSELPPVLAGPLLRRLEERRLVLWLVGSRALDLRLHLGWDTAQLGRRELALPLDDSRCQRLPVGRHAWLHLIEVVPDESLPADTAIHYDLHIEEGGQTRAIVDWAPHLLYPGQTRPSFVRRGRLDHLLHGSCRKPPPRVVTACYRPTACSNPPPPSRPSAPHC